MAVFLHLKDGVHSGERVNRKEGKYTFCTPGHMAGTAFQKSPVSCLFYDFFGANTLKADVSISVTALGSLLDHWGPLVVSGEMITEESRAVLDFLLMLCPIAECYPGFETDIHGAKLTEDGRYLVKVWKAPQSYIRQIWFRLFCGKRY